MKQLLKNKAGVTVLEGVIALGLLALITAGAFGVLLSASRQSSVPDIREEMSYAVEKAGDLLKVYINAQQDDFAYEHLPGSLSCGPCGNMNASGACTQSDLIHPVDRQPLSAGEHNIRCLLPPVCDRSNSSFSYMVASSNIHENKLANASKEPGVNLNGYKITFTISCNGYEL
ncbi:MAG: hypothetical protein IJ266_04635 [Elusimicrobiaceae bacterium]|nr:hypothetical protein [Elusimicrobiaceae bacterium]